jgi:hypothetical protein
VETNEGRSPSNSDVRRMYLERVSHIPQLNEVWNAEGTPARERAERAWGIRHDARLEARRLMSDAKEVEMLRARDLARYGSVDGPTFEWLVENLESQGLSGDALYEAIIEGSFRTNEALNRLLEG